METLYKLWQDLSALLATLVILELRYITENHTHLRGHWQSHPEMKQSPPRSQRLSSILIGSTGLEHLQAMRVLIKTLTEWLKPKSRCDVKKTFKLRNSWSLFWRLALHLAMTQTHIKKKGYNSNSQKHCHVCILIGNQYRPWSTVGIPPHSHSDIRLLHKDL